jgi:hypothetical protein
MDGSDIARQLMRPLVLKSNVGLMTVPHTIRSYCKENLKRRVADQGMPQPLHEVSPDAERGRG